MKRATSCVIIRYQLTNPTSDKWYSIYHFICCFSLLHSLVLSLYPLIHRCWETSFHPTFSESTATWEPFLGMLYQSAWCMLAGCAMHIRRWNTFDCVVQFHVSSNEVPYPLFRWGGNAASRYNYVYDVSNVRRRLLITH